MIRLGTTDNAADIPVGRPANHTNHVMDYPRATPQPPKADLDNIEGKKERPIGRSLYLSSPRTLPGLGAAMSARIDPAKTSNERRAVS